MDAFSLAKSVMNVNSVANQQNLATMFDPAMPFGRGQTAMDVLLYQQAAMRYMA
jgi:hypothetical protein